jgi:hypothetical protein
MEQELIRHISIFIEENEALPNHTWAKEKAIELSKSGASFKASKGWYEKFLSRHFTYFRNQINKPQNDDRGNAEQVSEHKNHSIADHKGNIARLRSPDSIQNLSNFKYSFFKEPSTPNVKRDNCRIEVSASVRRPLASEASDSVVEPDLYQQSIRKVDPRNNFTDIKHSKRI